MSFTLNRSRDRIELRHIQHLKDKYNYTNNLDKESGKELENQLRECFSELGYTFIELDYDTGYLQYRVEHF